MDALTRTKLQKIGLAPPDGGAEGDLWWNQVGHRPRFHDGTSLRDVAHLDDLVNAVQSVSLDQIVVSTDPNTAITNGTLLIVIDPGYPTYFTNFSDQTVGSSPTGWTARWITSQPWTVVTDATATGGISLSLTAGSGRRAITWDAPSADADRADVEVVFKWKANTLSWPSALVRASGAAGAETGYAGGVGSSGTSIAFANIFRLSAGASTETHATKAFVGNTWYVTRFRANAADIKVKSWLYNSGTVAADEPSTWDITLASGLSDILTAGWVGLMCHAQSSEQKWFDWIGVATKGGSAPIGA